MIFSCSSFKMPVKCIFLLQYGHFYKKNINHARIYQVHYIYTFLYKVEKKIKCHKEENIRHSLMGISCCIYFQTNVKCSMVILQPQEFNGKTSHVTFTLQSGDFISLLLEDITAFPDKTTPAISQSSKQSQRAPCQWQLWSC